MDRNYINGIKFSLGFFSVTFLLFGIIYAVGFHPSSDILAGTFIGNYTFQDNVTFQEEAIFSQVSLIGTYNSTNLPSCDNSKQGKLIFLNDTKVTQICNSEFWKTLASGPVGCSSLSGDWIEIPGNTDLGTSDFCVMKFEAKDVGGVATSQPSLTPWASITQTSAITECSNLGSGYQLITNAQWTTIARNAELVDSNWNSSTSGVGSMWIGHTDNVPANALAVSNISDYYDGTGQSSPSTQRRVLDLSNGEQIWDLSGNIWNWNSDTCTQGDPWSSTTPFIDWTNADVNGVEKTLAGPLGDFTSANGVGQYYGCTIAGNAFLRGGRWDYAVSGGAFSLHLVYAPSDSDPSYGFRCTYTP